MNGVNLIPARRRESAARRARVHRWMLGGGSYTLALAAASVFVQTTRVDAPAAAAALAAESVHVRNLQSSVEAVRLDLAGATAAHDTLAVLADPPDWSLLLADLSSAVGDDTVLREVRLEGDARDLGRSVGAQPKSYVLSLHGICPSQAAVSQFVQRLQHPPFVEVKLLRTAREPYLNKSAASFEIQCIVGASVSVPSAGKSGGAK